MIRLLQGDCLEVMRRLSDESINCCITSPPYFGLRDYGTGSWAGGNPSCAHLGPVQRTAGGLHKSWDSVRGTVAPNLKVEGLRVPFKEVCQLCGARRVDKQVGLDASLDDYVERLVAIFREVWRVLRPDATLWLNLGDCYNVTNRVIAANADLVRPSYARRLKPKDLLGVPWTVAFALRASGWYLRQDIIWAKSNPMPESVVDRCTKAHEYIFLFSKSARYYYNAGAILEPFTASPKAAGGFLPKKAVGPNYRGGHSQWENRRTKEQGHPNPDGRNKRSVWEIAVSSFTGGHFATYPPALIEPCVLAGCPSGGWVLDPFSGAGTTGLVADRKGRNAVLIELNPDYVNLSAERLHADAPFTMEITRV